ncbi:MAG: hypothetical protein O0X96_05620 [Methanocorpusculum sp.]|nr:hypothetical protein [Methanocorpusculum sp.]MDE2524589.1 hypothetical protein [Methanocorpusculum sp.]
MKMIFPESYIQVGVKLSPEDIAKLDALAAKNRLSRAGYLRVRIGEMLDKEYEGIARS